MKCHKNVITPLPSPAQPRLFQPDSAHPYRRPPDPTLPDPPLLCKHIQTHTHLHVCVWREVWVCVVVVGGLQLVVFSSLWVPTSAWSSGVAHNNPITAITAAAVPGGPPKAAAFLANLWTPTWAARVPAANRRSQWGGATDEQRRLAGCTAFA